MIQNLRFGQMYRMNTPIKEGEFYTANYPEQILQLDKDATFGIADNITDLNPVIDAIPALLTGEQKTAPQLQRTFLLVTEEDAFAVAKKAGLDVSLTRSKAENEAVAVKHGSLVTEIEAHFKEQEAAGRKVIDLTA